MGYCEATFVSLDGEELEFEDFKEDVDDSTEPVPTMNRERRCKGYKSGCVKYSWSGSLPVPKGSSIDLQEYLEKRKSFSVIAEHEDGFTNTYLECRLKKVGIESKEADSTKYSVEGAGLDRVRS